MTAEPTPNRQRGGADLVREARAASGKRPSALGEPVERASSGFRGFLGDMFGEMIGAVLALALFAGVGALNAWGWNTSRVGTVGVYLIVATFLGYGVVVLWRRRKGSVPAWKLASIAAGTVIVVAFWLTYVVMYHY